MSGARAEAAAARRGVETLPLVQKVLDHFPGAEITAVRGTEPPADVAAEMAAPTRLL